MPTQWIRRGPVLLVVALLTTVGWIGGHQGPAPRDAVAAAPANALHMTAPYSLSLSPGELAALAEVRRAAAARGSAPARPLGPAQEPVMVEFQTFDGAEFPPGTWIAIDKTSGAPNNWLWGRQTCEIKPRTGGEGAAWSVGGGTKGSAHTCWAPHPAGDAEKVDTQLIFPGIDTTSFQGGISVMFDIKADVRLTNAFQFCIQKTAFTAPVCRGFSNLDSESLRNQWVDIGGPALFPDATGSPDLMVLFTYTDLAPSGNNRGVILDNVVIQGLPAPWTPTPSPVPATVRPTRTRVPTATLAPTEVPPPPGTRVFLPSAFRNAALSALAPAETPAPPTETPTDEPTDAPSLAVNVQLGSGLDEVAHELIGPGTQFQFGIMALCQMTRWTDVEPGTPLTYRWFIDGALDAALNRTEAMQARGGSLGYCVHWTSGQTGQRVPVPRGQYRVDVYANADGSGSPVATASAVISDEVPPDATPIPSPTPVPTAEPGTYSCRDLVANGDFEQGAGVGWSLAANYTVSRPGEQPAPPPVTEVVKSNADFPTVKPARNGEWFGMFRKATGLAADTELYLYQTDVLPQIAADDVVSATLEFYVSMMSDQAPNGTREDTMTPVLFQIGAGGGSTYFPLLDAAADRPSEESATQGRYVPWRVRLSADLFRDSRVAQSHLGFLVHIRQTAETLFFLDDMRMDVCTRAGAATPAVARAAGSVSSAGPSR